MTTLRVRHRTFFFFYYYGNHQDLHSFPTRRSSDLSSVRTSDTRHGPTPSWPKSGSPAGTDRKSTRLNSSHSQISYAVFCLKKKNKDLYNFIYHDAIVVSAWIGALF